VLLCRHTKYDDIEITTQTITQDNNSGVVGYNINDSYWRWTIAPSRSDNETMVRLLTVALILQLMMMPDVEAASRIQGKNLFAIAKR